MSAILQKFAGAYVCTPLKIPDLKSEMKNEKKTADNRR